PPAGLHRTGEAGVRISREACTERAEGQGVAQLSGQLGWSFDEVKASLREAVSWGQRVVKV
ncbi:histidine kinase, partial [Vibrio parahaemolyticus]|nr:histidine kinase [Vibrio parahaemolyticus]